MGRNAKCGEHNSAVYFKLTDEDKWKMIDRLMTLPKYAKSRNSLLNNALGFGLPLLIKDEFGEVALCEDAKGESYFSPFAAQNVSEEKIDCIVRLLKEIALYTSINKGLICSLFNAESRYLKKEPTTSEEFEGGELRDTPRYFLKEELEGLKNLREDDDE